MKSTLLIVALFACLLLAGCKSAESKVIGKWLGPDNKAAFELKGDKTFSAGEPMPVSGTWTMDEKTVTLKVEKIQNKPKAQFLKEQSDQALKMGIPKATIDAQMKQAEKVLSEMKLTIGEAGETLIMQNPMGGTTTLVKAK